MFYDALKLGKQIITTTHSIILPMSLLRFFKKAKDDRLSPKDLVAIYELKRTKEGVKVYRLGLTDWSTVRSWISLFREIEEELLKE